MNFELPTYVEKSKPKSLNVDGDSINDNAESAYASYIGRSISREFVLIDSLRARFNQLKSQWLHDIGITSNSDQQLNNSNYLQIIQMGLPVVQFLLEDLDETNTHWFHALMKITGSNPIQPNHRGNIEAMKNDWIAWANANIYT